MEALVTAAPKSVQMADIIRREIMSGKFKKGERLLPTRDMAELYSVSSRVAQSAFEILRREGLIDSHVGRGTFVALAPKSIASRTAILALTGLDDQHALLNSLLPSALLEKGLFSYLFDINDLDGKANQARLRELLDEKPLAFVADGCSRFNFDVLKWLSPVTRLIFVRRFEGASRYQASYVLADYEGAARTACEYLLSRSRKRLALLSGKRRPGWVSDLLAQGCESVFGAFKHINCAKMSDTELDRALFSDGAPDAMFCDIDFRLVKASELFARRKLLHGRDFDMVGFGDTPWAKSLRIPSIDFRRDLIAKKVAEILESGEDVDIKIAPDLRHNT